MQRRWRRRANRYHKQCLIAIGRLRSAGGSRNRVVDEPAGSDADTASGRAWQHNDVVARGLGATRSQRRRGPPELPPGRAQGGGVGAGAAGMRVR
eukprot:2468012-Pleurochrysis_carterae.AAC.1